MPLDGGEISTAPMIEASPRKRVECPFCKAFMVYEGDGRYVCPQGCGEFLRDEPTPEPPKSPKTTHAQLPWPELVEGMPEHLRQGMIDIATLPLRTYEIGPCQGHGGKGGGGKSGRGKSSERQKADTWVRKMLAGRFIKSIGRG